MRQAPAVGKLMRNIVFDGIGRCIEHCYILRSIPISTDTMYKAKEEITDYVLKRYTDLTLGEIGMALDMGARGELGNRDAYANIANMEAWIRTYAESEQRADLKNEEHEERTAKSRLPEPTADERNEAMYRQAIPDLIAYYREHGDIMVPAGVDDERGIHLPAFGAVLWDMMVARNEQGATAMASGTLMELAEAMRSSYLARKRFKLDYDSETYAKCILLRERIKNMAYV